MTPAPAAVTARGVRDGDRAALAALVERRGAAVLAYCDHLAEPDKALEAAGEAFADFRREVREAEDPVALDPEAILLRTTRRAAAARAPRPAPSSGLLGSRRAATCQLVPELLAARADGELSTADRLRLGRHLERCEDCRAAEERFAAAHRAYAEAPTTPPEAGVAGGLVAALRAAAPNADERASHPEPAARRPEPQAEPAAADGASAVPAEADDAGGPPTLSWDPAEVLAAAGAAKPRRNWRGLVVRIVIPAGIALVAGLIAFIVGGAFRSDAGNGPSDSIQTEGAVPTSTVRVLQRPTTTPLPPAGSTGNARSALPVPVRRAQRVSAPARGDVAPAQRTVRPVVADGTAPAQAITPAPAPRESAASLHARTDTGGTEAAPPTTGGAPARSDAGFTPGPAP